MLWFCSAVFRNIVPVLVRPAFNHPASQGSPGRTALPLQLHYVPCCRWFPGFWPPRFFVLLFLGFGGCIAAARSGAEFAAALLHAASASCWSHHRTCFFGFSGCGAAACSGAELAAALLLALRPPKSFRAAARSACAPASHASLLCRSMRWARLVSACRCRFAARSTCRNSYM